MTRKSETKDLFMTGLAAAFLAGCGSTDPVEKPDDPGLYDQQGRRLGAFMAEVDFSGALYEVMTPDGFRAVIDLDDASIRLRPELSGLSCHYRTEDCSGICYGQDRRYAGFVVPGPGEEKTIIAFHPQAVPESFVSLSLYDADAEECRKTSVRLSYAPPGHEWSGDLSQDPEPPLYISSKAGRR